jgi:DNA repair protein RadC
MEKSTEIELTADRSTTPAPASLLKRLPAGDRPRERLLRSGASVLSDAELLAVLLRIGRPGLSALEMGRELLDERGGLAGLMGADKSALRRRGLGAAKAATLLAAIELGRRLARTQISRSDPMDRPEAVADYLMLRYGSRDQEVMGALHLDVRNRLIAEGEIYRGTLSRTVVEPRAILKEALLRSASGIILFHTHPSGDPSPSVEDLAFTRRMVNAGELLGIRILDHMILGDAGSWVSLQRRGAW